MPKPPAALPHGFDLALVLGGGNALGAYHLGVCEVLLRAGAKPGWIVGTSIGAVTGAILAGNPPETRLERLAEFWRASAHGPFRLPPLPHSLRARLNTDFALAALLLGRPGLFGGRFPGLWSLLPGMPGDRALRDHRPLVRSLEQLVDFDRLNGGGLPLSFVALDMESGEEVWFDTREQEVGPEHLLAATALAPLFPPVEIDGRLLCDAGLANNLPFDRVFRTPPERPQLCIAVDPFALGHGRPDTLEETLARVQDLAFASQTRRALGSLARERALFARAEPGAPPAILAHLAYRAPGHQRALKGLDYSAASLAERADAGRADMAAMLPRVAAAPRTETLVYLGPA
jgi:NTE family protein